MFSWLRTRVRGFKKGTGTFVRSTLRAVPAKVPDSFLNHAYQPSVEALEARCLLSVNKEVLAFYYPWYGNPQVSGSWVHWQGVDAVNHTIDNATHYPELGAYDSH